MKQLTTYINEKLILNKGTFKKHYNYFPKTKDELKDIIKQLAKEYEDEPVLDLNEIDISKITDMSNLFEGMHIKEIDISGWDVSNVKNMSSMFSWCEKLTDIGDISVWNVSNIEYMHFMFFNCKNLKSVGDLSSWDVSGVTNMYCMFYGCKNLTDIGDLSSWDISNVKNITTMFYKSGITNIPSWYKK